MLANKYTLLITPTQVRLIHNVECFQTSHYISQINFDGKNMKSLEQAILQSLEKLTDRRAKIYVRVSYPFIKTDVLSATSTYLNHKQSLRRAKHLFDTNYGETVLDATFKLTPTKFERPSVVECIDNKVLEAINSALNGRKFKPVEITSVHSWIINSLDKCTSATGLLFCQDDIYTYSVINNSDIAYVAQFRCQLDHLVDTVFHQIKKSVLISPTLKELTSLLFLTDAKNNELINLNIGQFKIEGLNTEIRHRVGML